jgi:hypothetical protein
VEAVTVGTDADAARMARLRETIAAIEEDARWRPFPSPLDQSALASARAELASLEAGSQSVSEYAYEFSVWPERGWEQPVYEMFRNLGQRMIMTFTEAGFTGFRDSLERSGLTLREVTRVPHHEPEAVA